MGGHSFHQQGTKELYECGLPWICAEGGPVARDRVGDMLWVRDGKGNIRAWCRQQLEAKAGRLAKEWAGAQVPNNWSELCSNRYHKLNSILTREYDFNLSRLLTFYWQGMTSFWVPSIAPVWNTRLYYKWFKVDLKHDSWRGKSITNCCTETRNSLRVSVTELAA